MAQPIRCDYTGCDQLGDVLITRIANGETLAWCDTHYLAVVVAIADAAAEAEAAATAADAAAQLGVSDDAAAFPTSLASSGADDLAPGQRGRPADGRDASGTRQRANQGRSVRPGPSESVTDDRAETPA